MLNLEYTNLARLFSELIREDIFSHVLYGRQLIAREILKRPALDEVLFSFSLFSFFFGGDKHIC